MKIDDNIEKSEDGLEQLIDAALMFEENHYLDAIRQKKLDEYDILQLIEDVRLWHSRMRKEQLKLAKLSEHWIEDYATNCNNRYKEAYDLFVKVRSCISSSRKLFKKFCRRVMNNPTNGNASRNVLDRSVLSANVVSLDIFGLKSYQENVVTLYEEMSSFFATLVGTLALCHRMLRDEAITKNDPERVWEIYQKCKNELLSSARMFARTFNIDVKQITESELIERRKKAKNVREYIHRNYHCLNKAEYATLIAYEVVQESNNNGLTEQETLLWGNDVEMVMKVRNAIVNIERLATGKKKISGYLMLQFIKWCKVKKEHEHSLYNYFCDTYKGKIPPVGWTQVFNTRKDLVVSDEELAQAFEKELQTLLSDAA